MNALVRAVRPRQWTKNVLVVAGPLAAGTLGQLQVAVAVAVAFVAFCLAASGVYLINDVIDRENDRAHPVKRARPIASGELSVRTALVVAVLLLAGSLLGVLALGYEDLAVVLGTYSLLQVAYCLWLKHEAVIDLVVVSSGFLLRALAGGVAAAVVLSPWFLLVAAFGSLFMVAGKRYSEVRLVGEGSAATRRTLEEYSASYLRFVWGIASAGAVVFYAMWAFALEREHPIWPQLSLVPFVVALLRYAVDIDKGAAGEPESVVLGDRILQLLGVVWFVLFTIGLVSG
ncbi:decaprenyl-phosphate phosphoribosyltransferase [Cellulomonas flavigena]|uniref:decaprenyl-phosphate phosphoribosyltransferase n=1 Tax=Cellulomonas flavigena TaxID=1711 RepID=UPI00030218F0|nr:decaprenyl-phosphate phosphoribosyltransferase [Cellulomonas flavigena]